MSTTGAAARHEAIEHVTTTLLPQASLLTRLVAKQVRSTVTRSEGGVLRTVSVAPQRITSLAVLEGLSQPTMTIMVKRLEERGLVSRERDADDGRVVLVAITEAGREAMEELRAQYRALLRERLAGMADQQIAELEQATMALTRLVEALQQDATS
jgi:DNA-binding MarR family transcriptional regulator